MQVGLKWGINLFSKNPVFSLCVKNNCRYKHTAETNTYRKHNAGQMSPKCTNFFFKLEEWRRDF